MMTDHGQGSRSSSEPFQVNRHKATALIAERHIGTFYPKGLPHGVLATPSHV
jgi:hypothetical protein